MHCSYPKIYNDFKKFLLEWTPDPNLKFNIPHHTVLLSGPVHCGKTYLLDTIFKEDDIQKKFHTVPISLDDPLGFIKKRLVMKDVFCFFTIPVFIFDPLDSYIAVEKGIFSGIFKELKIFEGKNTKALIIFVSSPSIDKKLGDLKKHIKNSHIFMFSNTRDSLHDTLNENIYHSSDIYHTPSFDAFYQYFSHDPWLAPLTVIDEVLLQLKTDKKLSNEILQHVLRWGILANIKNDDQEFLQHSRVQVANCYLSFALYHAIKNNPSVCESLKKAQLNNSELFHSQFTKLLTLHSVRKRLWVEMHESGLPWIYDKYRRLGSKFSSSTLNLLNV